MVTLVGKNNPYVRSLWANSGFSQKFAKSMTLVEVSDKTLTNDLTATGVVWFPIDCVLTVSIKADRDESAFSWFAGYPHVVRLMSRQPCRIAGSVQSVWASETVYIVSVVRKGYAVQISEKDLWSSVTDGDREVFSIAVFR
jgi:hypothetical protein